MAVAKRYLNQGQNCMVTLLDPFKLEQIIISAARPGRKFAANQWPCVIDRALARLWIQELAGLAEDRIGLAPQDTLAFPDGGEAPRRGFQINREVFCQPF